mgnify:FL=1
MKSILFFLILSIPVIYFSRRNILHPHKHGFYRFLGWEGMIWLLVSNYHRWFTEPFSALQLISWVLLLLSVYLVVAGALTLLRKGKPSSERKDRHLFGFEKTTELVDTGIFRYIRHPLYASLICLSWGILLKNITPLLLVITLFCTLMFYITSRYDEKECIAYFGEKYRDYMKRTNMFIPFVF